MTHPKLKILCYAIISLMLLFTPFVLDISPDGNTYAMGFLGSSAGGGRTSGSRVAASNPNANPETSPVLNPTGSNPGAPAPVPEPATLLLFGAGAVGMAAFRKKFKKKQ